MSIKFKNSKLFVVLRKWFYKTREIKLKSVVPTLYRRLFLSSTNSLLLAAIVVGVVAGFLSVVFRKMLDMMHYFSFNLVFAWLQENVGYYTLPLIPIGGSLLLILIMKFFPYVSGGYGMPDFLRAIHLKGGYIKTREIFIRMITSTITISTGGSTGVEGPIAQIGGAAGSKIGRIFSMTSNRLKVLIAAGSAAGIAAQFNAPLAGVLFAQEVIMLGHFQLESFGAIIIASGIATAISRAYYSNEPLFGELSYTTSYTEIVFYCLLGICIGLIATVFIKFFYYTSDFFEKIKINRLFKPVIGAAIVGMLGLVHIGVLGDGYEIIRETLHSGEHNFTISILLLLVVLKMVATSITLGSKNVGGIFAPSLFLGAVFGAFFGSIIQYFLPGLEIEVGSYALIGMGAFLAATTHAPLTSIFLLFELTNDYHVIIPVMFASIIGVVSTKTLLGSSIDTMQLAREGIHLEEGHEISILQSVKVSKVLHHDYIIFQEGSNFASLLKEIPHSKRNYFPIINTKEQLTGIVSFDMIRDLILEEGLEHVVVMKDIMETEFTTIKENDSLAKALELFGSQELDVIPVVSQKNSKKLIGVIYHRDIIDQYHRSLAIKDFHGR